MSALIEAATHFNKAVESTGVVGSLRQEVADLKSDVGEIRGDVKHIRSTIDHWGGIAVVVSSIIAIATSLAVAVAGKAITSALGL